MITSERSTFLLPDSNMGGLTVQNHSLILFLTLVPSTTDLGVLALLDILQNSYAERAALIGYNQLDKKWYHMITPDQQFGEL